MGLVNPSRAASTAFGVIVLSALAAPGIAGDWKLTDRFSTSLSLSDNIDRTADGESGLIWDVTPALALTGRGARVNGAISFAPTFSQQFGGDDENRFSLNMNGSADAEVYENVLFVDARSTAGLTSISGRSNIGLGPSTGIGNDDITQFFTLAAGAELRNRFGRYADTRLRLDADLVKYREDSLDASNSESLNFVVNSGSHFPILPWTITFDTNTTRYDDRDDTRTSLDGQVRYRWDTHWLARFTIGVEDNEVQTLREDTSGPYWFVGGLWTPNPRTRLDFRYGERYFGPDWNLDFSHGTRRTTLTAAAFQTLTSERAERLGNAFLPPVAVGQTDPNIPPSLDPNTDLPPVLDEDYLNTGVRFGVALAGRRTDVSAHLGWSQRDYEFSERSEDTYSSGIRASRRLFGDYTAHAGFSWQYTDSSFDGDSQSYKFDLGASRSLGRRSSIGLNFAHYQDDFDTSASTTENRLTATFSTSFL